jgi:hypothetical protein
MFLMIASAIVFLAPVSLHGVFFFFFLHGERRSNNDEEDNDNQEVGHRGPIWKCGF